VLKWETANEDKAKKFDHLWKVTYTVFAYHGNGVFILQDQDGELTGGGPVNGWFLKHFLK